MSNGAFSVFDLSQVEVRVDSIARMLMVRPLRLEEPTEPYDGFRVGPPPLKRRRPESDDDEIDDFYLDSRIDSGAESDM